MDIERLNKSQIVLLTLLVSFVTSIATAIVTVSLMEQAPPVIPQTINRVVERTIERVVPKETQTATVVTTEKTVVVKETDLISQAIARIRPSVIRLHIKSADGSVGDFVARGFVIADTYAVASIGETAVDATYLMPVGDKSVEAKVVKVDEAHKLALLSLAEADGAHSPPASVATDGVILGQTVIGITGSTGLKVASGIIIAVNEAKAADGASMQDSFETNISDSTYVLGSPVLNSDGAIIGMFTGDSKVVPASILSALIRSITPADIQTSKATTTKSS